MDEPTSLRVVTRATEEDLEGLVVADGFAGIDGGGDPSRIHRELVGWAREPDAWVSVAVVPGRGIVGYVILAVPREPYWATAGDGVLEVVFAEVALPCRRHGVFRALASALKAEGEFERSIVFARLLAPYWDRRRNRLGGWPYRRMMVRFTSALGFEPFRTNDPIIARRPMNAAVRRIGSGVSEADLRRFEWVSRHGSGRGRRVA
jgi:hypothetical protein